MTEYTGRARHETYVGDNPPTTSQLFRLASQAMSMGRSTNKLRTLERTPRAHFSIVNSSYVNDIINSSLDEHPAEIQHRMAVRMGRRVLGTMPMKEWSMRVYDTRFYKTPTIDWTGVRTMYGFEWNRDTVMMSKRKSYFVPEPEQPDMEFYLERPSLVDRVVDFMAAEAEMAHVTADDCELLIAEAADYYAQQALLGQRGAA